jgi:aminoglycoside phosphotransferase (APT) family kinase protein
VNLAEINRDVTDRSDCFYWQTDRKIEPAQAGEIFLRRHEGIDDDTIRQTAADELIKAGLVKDGSQVRVVSRQESDQNNLGNVNAVRTVTTEDNGDYIMRMHPRGLSNGYFWAEALAAKAARQEAATFRTIAIHDLETESDFSYMLTEKLPGVAVQKQLEERPELEHDLLPKIGATMAKLHRVKVDGFGFFDNELAKKGELKGIKGNYRAHILAGLNFNLRILVEQDIVTAAQSSRIKEYLEQAPEIETKVATIVHNDFADWNLLTDGKEITGVLDWDECHAGHPVADIACWSTFFPPDRLEKFLSGYRSVSALPENFRETYELFRLRYLMSKMTLRLRRLSWDKSVKPRIESGKAHLADSIEYFKI